MRPIKELLVLLRDYLPGNINDDYGGSLCWAAGNMCLMDDVISSGERNDLLDYIEQHRPDGVGDYYGGSWARSGFWWPYGELTPRIEFLNKLIDEL
jgi:hypothetical protein